MEEKMYKTTIIKTKKIAKNTVGLVIKKPVDYSYKAGQYTRLSFSHIFKEGKDKTMRTLSIASTPKDKELLFAMRTSETKFKKNVKLASKKQAIYIDTAKGTLIVPPKTTAPIIFLAGGIGITPIRSMLFDLLENKKKQQAIYLFYSNKFVQESAFLDEFFLLSKKYPNFSFIPTVTKTKIVKNKDIEKQRIDTDLLTRYISFQSKSIYYLCGSHPFVEGMFQILRSFHIPPKNINHEVFCGYCIDHDCCCHFFQENNV